MSTVVESVDVAVPVHTAYNQWTQFEEFPRFMEGVEEIRQLDETHLHWVVNMAGARREFDAEITEQHPDERIAWHSLSGPRHAGVVTFHRLDDAHSRVTAQMELDPEGFVENVGDKTGMVDRRVKGDMKRFREFIEARGAETGAWRGDVDQPGARPMPTDQPGTYGMPTGGMGQAGGYGTQEPGTWSDPARPDGQPPL